MMRTALSSLHHDRLVARFIVGTIDFDSRDVQTSVYKRLIITFVSNSLMAVTLTLVWKRRHERSQRKLTVSSAVCLHAINSALTFSSEAKCLTVMKHSHTFHYTLYAGSVPFRAPHPSRLFSFSSSSLLVLASSFLVPRFLVSSSSPRPPLWLVMRVVERCATEMKVRSL